jgi:hypothetical protein
MEAQSTALEQMKGQREKSFRQCIRSKILYTYQEKLSHGILLFYCFPLIDNRAFFCISVFVFEQFVFVSPVLLMFRIILFMHFLSSLIRTSPF